MSKKRLQLTPERIAVNRANAKKSTGPRTEPGKRRAALNALKHDCALSLCSNPWWPAPSESRNPNAEKVHRPRCFEPVGTRERAQAERLAREVWWVVWGARRAGGLGAKPKCPLESHR